MNLNWSVMEKKRQMNTPLYKRLLLSKGDINKQEVLKLAAKGIELARPSDMIKDLYIFEFLVLPRPPLCLSTVQQ